jgi:uncharacterized protein YndB with AHSA1/START domain
MAGRGDGMFYKTGIILAVMIALILAVGFALPSTFRVERSAEIAGPPAQIFEQLNDFGQWTQWDPWLAKDQSLRSRHAGQPGVGQVLHWSSGGQNTGHCEIVESVPAERLVTNITFRDSGSPHRSTFLLTNVGGMTKVVWILEGENGMQPIGNYFGLMMDSFVGNMFEDGLRRLKRLVETGSAEPEKATPPSE